MLPYVRELRQQGHRCDVGYSIPEKYGSYRWLGWRLSQKLKWAVRRWQIFRASMVKYDAVIVEREMLDTPSGELELLLARTCSAKLILDIDDGIFLRYPEKFERILKVVDHVIAGSQHIANAIADRCQSISVIPTVVDLCEYPFHLRDWTDQPILGWIGTSSNMQYLDLIASPVQKLIDAGRIRVKVISNSIDAVEKLRIHPVEFARWTPETAVSELNACTIGIMPLQDTDWERYKCGCKLIQYMACGIPAVASPIGVNREIITHGDNGFLASSDQEWFNALLRLLDDHQLCNQFSQHGRKLAESRYSLESQVPRFWESIT